MAAAAACRGSTPSGGTGPWANAVLTMDPNKHENCATVICCLESRLHGEFQSRTEISTRVEISARSLLEMF